MILKNAIISFVLLFICTITCVAQQSTLDMLNDTKDLRTYMTKVLTTSSKYWMVNRFDKVTNVSIVHKSKSGQPSEAKIEYYYKSMGSEHEGWVELYLSDGIAYFMKFWDKQEFYVTPLTRDATEKNNFDNVLFSKIMALQNAFNNKIIAKGEEEEKASLVEVIKKQSTISVSNDIGGCLIQKTEVLRGDLPTSHTEWVQHYDSQGNVVADPTTVVDSRGTADRTVYGVLNNCSHTVILRGIYRSADVYLDASVVIKPGEDATFDTPITIEPHFDKAKLAVNGTQYFNYKSNNLPVKSNVSQSPPSNTTSYGDNFADNKYKEAELLNIALKPIPAFKDNFSATTKATCNKGLDAMDDKLYEKSLSILLPLAKAGYPPAQNGIGYLYQNGLGVEANPTAAFNWYLKAALKGLAIAENNLGVLYESGIGIEKDLKTAENWYMKAAAQHYGAAATAIASLNEVGGLYELTGEGVFQWYYKGAIYGDPQGEYKTAMCYVNGWGTKANIAEGIKWLKLSAKQGYQEAIDLCHERNIAF